MGRYRKLLGNSAVFAIGSLGSKLIAFLLVPFYTFVLSKQEFGTVDLITTSVNMLLPIISLSIFDAVFRFILDKNGNQDAIFVNGLFVTIVGSMIGVLLIPMLNFFHVSFSGYIYLMLITSAFLSLLLNFTRAIGHVKSFALAGILGTLITAGANVVLLYVFRAGVVGYLTSIIFSNILVCLFLVIVTKLWSHLNWRDINKTLMIAMITYSIPLIPNAFSWWINSSADRYFILIFVGAAANGIYAVASKIPSLLNVVNQIFFQAWQMSAVEEYESGDASKFYSKTFNYYMEFQFICVAGILLILKPMMSVIVSPAFYVSWKYVPFLLLAVVYSSLSGFLGTTYLAAKNTTGVFVTTSIGAIVNIIFGLMFVSLFGLQGASFAGALSFLIVLMIRLHDTQKFMPIALDKRNFILNHIVLLTFIGIIFISKQCLYSYLLEGLMFTVVLLINRKIIIETFNSLLNR